MVVITTLARQSEFPLDWVLNLVLLVNVVNVLLHQSVVQGGLHLDGTVHQLRGGPSGQPQEGLLLLGVETDIVILLFEGVVQLFLKWEVHPLWFSRGVVLHELQ